MQQARQIRVGLLHLGTTWIPREIKLGPALGEAAKRHCSSGQMEIASARPHRKDVRRKAGESGAPENQCLRKRATIGQSRPNGSKGFAMKSMSAKEAKNGFGLLLDTARAEPVTIEKHGRPVVVVLSTEEYERLVVCAEREKAGAERHDSDGD